MIDVTNKVDCTGCSACANACPVNCIEMAYDEKGFYYPTIDASKCIGCNKCERVCHYKKNTEKTDRDARYFAAYNKNDEELLNASSGGIFWALVKNTLADNGVVYGAVSDDGLEVKHIRAEDIETCKRMRKSKYQQSELNDCYALTMADVKAGREVLFSGTPCQVAALYAYLGKEYNNLTTVEVICHGVPSKKVFQLYLENMKETYNSEVSEIIWRDKQGGWEPNKVTVCLKDGRKISTPSSGNIYQKGFLQNLYLRPSCYQCRYAKLPRTADITLGDFWGYDGTVSNGNKGLSLVVVTGEKGNAVFEKIKDNLVYEEASEKYSKSRCRHLWREPKDNKHRNHVYNNLENITLDEITAYFSDNNLKKKLIEFRKKIRKALLKNG